MSKFATGVTVITTLDPAGNPHAMTANAFTSVCLEPPTLLVCVAHNTITYGYVEEQRRIGVNVLREEQEELGRYFARRPEQREGNPEYSYTIDARNVPELDGSMVFFDCDIVGAHAYGDHTIYVGEVRGDAAGGGGGDAADVLRQPLVSSGAGVAGRGRAGAPAGTAWRSGRSGWTGRASIAVSTPGGGSSGGIGRV